MNPLVVVASRNQTGEGKPILFLQHLPILESFSFRNLEILVETRPSR